MNLLAGEQFRYNNQITFTVVSAWHGGTELNYDLLDHHGTKHNRTNAEINKHLSAGLITFL